MGKGTGWSGPNLERSARILDDYERPLATPRIAYEEKWAWDLDGAKESSWNHRATAQTAEAARAALARGKEPAERWNHARDVAIGFYRQHLDEIGLWAGEQGVPDNHTHQHLTATMGRLAAVCVERRSSEMVAAMEPADSELLRLSANWLQAMSAMMAAFSTPDCQLWMVGFRAHEGSPPLSFYGTAWNRQLRGFEGPLPEFTGKRGEANWQDSAATGVRCLRYLQRQGDGAVLSLRLSDFALRRVVEPRLEIDGFARGASGVLLKWPVTVYRGKDRFLAVLLPGGPKAGDNVPWKEVCDWIEVPYLDRPSLKATGNQVRYGHNWQTRPPAPPKDAIEIRFKARNRGGS